MMLPKRIKTLVLSSVLAFGSNLAWANCNDLPSFQELKDALDASGATAGPADANFNGGFMLNMWGTVVDRDGIVCQVAFTGADRGSQWPGSRVISAAKAYTGNAYSLPGLALSTANLYASGQPGGSLWGLQFSNPVDPKEAYDGKPSRYGTNKDPMRKEIVHGQIVFGGGFGLYNSSGEIVGGLGVSGDTSCKDHNFGWRVRNALGLDFVPGGVNPDALRPDNIVYDMGPASTGVVTSTSGFGHVDCGLGEKEVSESGSLPAASVP